MPSHTSPTGERYGRADTFEDATACVSDLEDVKDELDSLAKVAHVGAIGRINKASRLIGDAIELLMHIDNTDD
jgi:hypothetical protein